MDLAVPLASDVPRISFTQAYAVCALGSPGCTTSKGPTITLALVTSPLTGSANSDGSIAPLLNRSLTYVLTWDDVQCPLSAGPAGASHDTTPRYGCMAGIFVDANTGQSVYSYDGGPP